MINYSKLNNVKKIVLCAIKTTLINYYYIIKKNITNPSQKPEGFVV